MVSPRQGSPQAQSRQWSAPVKAVVPLAAKPPPPSRPKRLQRPFPAKTPPTCGLKTRKPSCSSFVPRSVPRRPRRGLSRPDSAASVPPAPFSVLTRRPPCRQRGRGGREPRSSRFSSQRLARRRPASRICRTDVSPDSPDSPDCQIAQKRKVRWTWICQSSESDESVKRAFRPGLSLKHLTSIAPLCIIHVQLTHTKNVFLPPPPFMRPLISLNAKRL